VSLTDRLNEDRVERALALLAETDLEVAEWKGAVLRTEHMAKVAEAVAYKSFGSEGSVEDRKQQTKLAPEVQKAWEEHFLAVVKHEGLKARREREFIVIDLFRTIEASRRKGNV
jgi:hypothetical protein